jgi:hypothetical protein
LITVRRTLDSNRVVFTPVRNGRELVSIQKWLICPISALREKSNPRNINHMPVKDPEPFIGAVKFSTRLDLEQIILFLDGHEPYVKDASRLDNRAERIVTEDGYGRLSALSSSRVAIPNTVILPQKRSN